VSKTPYIVCVALWAAAASAPARKAEAPPPARHVLVVFAADDPASAAAAKYYAQRRDVPAENLLGLTLARAKGRRGRWTYREFFEKILTPVRRKLTSKGADGKPLADRIVYILMCPGTPVTMVTHPAPAKSEKSWARKTRNRSVDGYLISVTANVGAGMDKDTGLPGPGRAGPIGATFAETTLPVFGAFRSPTGRRFRQMRRDASGRYDFYLVARLGLDLVSARDMLDGALYAERHLRLPAPEETTALRPEIWLDMKYRFAGDHVAAMSRTVPLVQGVPGSPFSAGKGLWKVWPLVIDTAPAEIGAGKAAGHKPTVVATIAAVDAAGVTLRPPGRAGRAKDVSGVLYFPPGCEVVCAPPKPKGSPKAATTPAPAGPPPRARVVGMDPAKHRLLLSSTKGFKPGQLVRYVWGGTFPTRNCFIFYGFYGLGQFEDVRQFPPGAIGVHVDSCCMAWAGGSIRRGIAATFGVTTEPLSAGIPYGHLMIRALATGHDWAEAAYGATRFGQRWTGVVFGDPIYAPFRSKQRPDTTPPVIGPVTFKPAGSRVTVAATLEGKTADELADVALFRLEYGPTTAYGQAVEFFDWPEPEKGRNVKGRRFGYSRHFQATLKGLKKGATTHWRLTARDPAGNETRTQDATFRP